MSATVVPDTHTSPPREVAPGIWWLPECLVSDHTGQQAHVHVAPFLVVGETETLLYDTGPPAHWDTVRANIRSIIGERPIDWIAPSHPEVPHCGNIEHLFETYPDSRVIGDIRDYHCYYPDCADRFEPRGPQAPLDLGGGYEITLLPAPIKDLPSSQWAYERRTQTMFVADAFSFTHHPELEGPDDMAAHRPGECTLLSSELDKPPELDQIVWINERALFWTRFADVERYLSATEALFQDHPSRLLAPAHGAVIDDIDTVLPIIWEAYRIPGRR
jgi:glyoxylase-like metal-dependent hydrolase (beta-lactamase superfamily II)